MVLGSPKDDECRCLAGFALLIVFVACFGLIFLVWEALYHESLGWGIAV